MLSEAKRSAEKKGREEGGSGGPLGINEREKKK